MVKKILYFLIVNIIFYLLPFHVIGGEMFYKGVFFQDFQIGPSKIIDFINQNNITFIMVDLYWDEIPDSSIIKELQKLNIAVCINWVPILKKDNKEVDLKDIMNGKEDKVIESFGNKLKECNRPIFISFCPDMNNEKFHWSGFYEGAYVYRETWKYLFKRLKQYYTELYWLFIPSIYNSPDRNWNKIKYYYPGNEFVHWVGLDARYLPKLSFVELNKWLDMQFNELKDTAPNKPTALLIKENTAIFTAFAEKKDINLVISDEQALTEKSFKKVIKGDIDKLIALQNKYKDILESSKKAQEIREAVKHLSCYPIPKEVKIDGNLDEWGGLRKEERGVMSIKTAQPASDTSGRVKSDYELSGVFCIRYDKEYLYVAAKINDDSLINEQEGADLWKQDCIELWFDMRNDDNMIKRMPNEPDDVQINIAPLTKGKLRAQAWAYRNPGDLKKLISSIECASSKTKEGYIIEAKIPVKYIDDSFVPEPGKVIGFNFSLINYNYSGLWIHYVWNGKTPEDSPNFGQLIFK